jgi:hypothetical protein
MQSVYVPRSLTASASAKRFFTHFCSGCSLQGATATITFAALRDVARILDKSGGTKASDLARDIQRELIEKDTDPVTYSLTLSELDEPYFLKAIKADPPTIPHSRLRSHALIQNAYTHSVERLNAVVTGMAMVGTGVGEFRGE